MLRLVGKGTVRTDFNLLALLFLIAGRSGTILVSVHRTVAKETVELRKPLMTGIILAILVCKKAMGIGHVSSPKKHTCPESLGVLNR